jgi:L,D-peptidoglycan transpeptidase YkuD (ErfK/YbiS/YcfS/YnhG family)
MVVTRWGARFMGRRFPCSVGRGGIAPGKTEGDGVSPAGAWRIVGAGYRPDRMRAMTVPFRLKAIGIFDIWSDDPADPSYNHGLRAPGYPFSHEKLRRADPLYDLVLISDWNWPDAQPGRGSAIFIHQWRKPRFPTAGCIAFSRADLAWIASRWRADVRVFVRP